MADKKADANSSSGKRTLEILGVIFTALALVVGIYFGVRAEQHKSILVQYDTLRSLVSVTSNTSHELTIAYRGQPIANPHLLSAHIENTGTQVIEEKDVERPVTLTFGDAKVVGAEITSTYPPEVNANISTTDHGVVINHKLLNPSDRISFDILIDGEAKHPEAIARIAGVKALEITNMANTDSRSPRIAPEFRGLAIFSSSAVLTAAFAAAAVALGFLWRVFAAIFFGSPLYSPKDLEKFTNFIRDDLPVGSMGLLTDKDLLLPETQRILEIAPTLLRVEIFDDPEGFKKSFQIFAGDLKEISLTPQEAGEKVLNNLRPLVPKIMSEAVWTLIPDPFDDRVKPMIAALPFVEPTYGAYVEKVKSALTPVVPSTNLVKGFAAIDRDDITLAVISLFFSIIFLVSGYLAWSTT